MTHAGTETQGKGQVAVNVTMAVIDACDGTIDGIGCLEVCGTDIRDTNLCSTDSALEAMCDSPGKPIFHLTAMALNCCISGFGSDCAGDSYLSQLFADANNACAIGESYRVDEVDCWNNGGMWSASEGCQTGLENNCHDRELCNEEFGVCFDGGPAGSSKLCNQAKKNNCSVSADGGSCD